MDEVPDAMAESLAKRVLSANFAAIHVRAYHRLQVYHDVHPMRCLTDVSQRMCELVTLA